jgi:RNA polymerase Rpb4
MKVSAAFPASQPSLMRTGRPSKRRLPVRLRGLPTDLHGSPEFPQTSGLQRPTRQPANNPTRGPPLSPSPPFSALLGSCLCVQLKNYFDKQAPHIQHQSDESVTKFLGLIGEYQLTKVEKLMILNSRPTSLAMLHVLIEEHEDRFTMEQMDDILIYVRECFPVPLQE